MSSLFTKSEKVKAQGMFGYTNVPFYLQFVPGNVVDVVTSDASLNFLGNNTINSIFALPHITNDTYLRRDNLPEKYRYYPLFRGIVDVPVKGDPVLLCTIGKTNYYLGPLNTETNLPTYNIDSNKISEVSFRNNDVDEFNIEYDGAELKGENPNFMQDLTNHKRIHKVYNDILDNPWNPETNLPAFISGSVQGRHIRDIHGDMVFEGRHGNSMRIGSRHKNPYIIISNSREENNKFEGIGDGSLISITERGSLAQHFGGYTQPNSNAENAINGNLVIPSFVLASDSVYNFKRSMGELIKISNGGQLTVQEAVYGYTGNQILFHSDRITINSKKDDLFLSSYKDIHIGSGRNLTISTNEDLIIESRNIYLGKASNYNLDQNPESSTYGQFINGESRAMEPMVLGQELLDVLNDLVDCLSTACYITPAGAPAPLIDGDPTGPIPIAKTDNPSLNRKSLSSIKDALGKIISNYHYIEPNDMGNTKDPQETT